LVFVYVTKKHRPKRLSAYQKAEPGIFLGYRGTRVALVYKYRTRKVHEEYHVTYCESEFPGLKLEPNDLNPLLSKEAWAKYGIEYIGPELPRGLKERVNSPTSNEDGHPISFSMDEDEWEDIAYDGEIQSHTNDEGG
jgi:hypothetical protein